MDKKLTRHGKQWIAMSRADWAREAGLSLGELKNRALPKLKKLPFVEIKAMRLTASTPKVLWMHLDMEAMNEHFTPLDIYEDVLNGAKMPGYEKAEPAYPYGKQDS